MMSETSNEITEDGHETSLTENVHLTPSLSSTPDSIVVDLSSLFSESFLTDVHQNSSKSPIDTVDSQLSPASTTPDISSSTSTTQTPLPFVSEENSSITNNARTQTFVTEDTAMTESKSSPASSTTSANVHETKPEGARAKGKKKLSAIKANSSDGSLSHDSAIEAMSATRPKSVASHATTPFSKPDSPEIYSEEHQLQVRLDAALRMASIMSQDFLQMVLECHFEEPWDYGKLWSQWYTANLPHMKKYKFLDKHKTEEVDGNEIVTFTDLDVTIIGHILEKLGTRDQKHVFGEVKSLRNASAHCTSIIITRKDFEIVFSKILCTITSMFATDPDRLQKWTEHYIKIKCGSIQDPEIRRLSVTISELKEDIHNNFSHMRQSIGEFKSSMRQNLSLHVNKQGKEIMEDLQITLQDHVKANLSTIRIPASSTIIDLAEVVLNQSMHCWLDQDDEDQAQYAVETDEFIANEEFLRPGTPEVESGRESNKEPNTLNEPNLMIDTAFFPTLDDNSDSELDEDDPSDTDSDTENNADHEAGFVRVCFQRMCDIIEAVIKRGGRMVLVTAPGGRGKTTAAKKLVLEWAKGEYLESFYVVVRLDVKQIQFDKSLFQNILIQYPILEGKYNSKELLTIEDSLRNYQNKVLIIFDGIDESQSHKDAEKFIIASRQRYSQSVFMMLTREEGKPILGTSIVHAAEFRMNDLDETQCQEFVQKFPFSGANSEEKRQTMIKAWEHNDVIRSAFPVPLNAAMLCRLYDDSSEVKLGGEIDLIAALLGTLLKAREMKELGIALEKPELVENVGQLIRRRNTIQEKSSTEVMNEKKELLVKLGSAIFECNGNSFVGFQDLDAEHLKHALKKLEVSTDDITYITRLDIFEQKMVERRKVFQFYHRNIREFIVALFGSAGTKALPQLAGQSRLKDAHLSVYRCILTQLHMNEGDEDVFERVTKVTTHFLRACQGMSEWGIAQVIAEVVEFGTTFPSPGFSLKDVLSIVTSEIEMLKIPVSKKLIKALRSDYLKSHLIEGKIDCTHCKLPKRLNQKAVELFESQSQNVGGQNWPQNKSFALSPFLFKGENVIVFCLPKRTWRKHISSKSSTLRFKRPSEFRKGLIKSPIPLKIHDGGSSIEGCGMIVEVIDGKVLVWGGSRSGEPHDPSIVHIFDIKMQSWYDVTSTGNIHEGCVYAASVCHRDKIFMFGGITKECQMNLVDSNHLSTLSKDGKFHRVPVEGKLPSPRVGAAAWEYEGNLFFAFGYRNALPDAQEENFISGGDWTVESCKGGTNQVLIFDVRRKSFSFYPTRGATPAPRNRCACAKLESKVYVHGGAIYPKPVKSFSILDMVTREWTKIEDTGLPFVVAGHTLTVVGPKQIMVLGGAQTVVGKNASNLVMLYNTRASLWTEDQRLPEAFCGEKGGLSEHKAVAVKNGRKVAQVFCVGGFVSERKFSTHFLEFQIKT